MNSALRPTALPKAAHMQAEVEGKRHAMYRHVSERRSHSSVCAVVEGNVEYKYKLTDLSEDQLAHRITQLNWYYFKTYVKISIFASQFTMPGV